MAPRDSFNSRKLNDRYEQEKNDSTRKKPNNPESELNSEYNHSTSHNAANISRINEENIKTSSEKIADSTNENPNNPEAELNSEDHHSIVGNVIDIFGTGIQRNNGNIGADEANEYEHADEIENKNNDKNENNTEEKVRNENDKKVLTNNQKIGSHSSESSINSNLPSDTEKNKNTINNTNIISNNYTITNTNTYTNNNNNNNNYIIYFDTSNKDTLNNKKDFDIVIEVIDNKNEVTK
ncbi:hypothetical protein PIROE2DRAFT_17033 [Piromyces sp. E2]|nr:hypothetical protein PIROE2DRAFT_17033 [Piromyces sp. E2]|eukprot:OUM57852.1 hypothetical protein PIROE2DRAFT_17033 [Piromyces sp. E2]